MHRDVNIDAVRAELDDLHRSQREIERLIERKKILMLKALPGVHGFESMDAFIGTLAQFASNDLRERIGAAQPASSRRGKPRSYPAELRVAARKSLEAGESAASVARARGVSLATIGKWKKLWGFDSPRSGTRQRAASADKGSNSETSVASVGNGADHEAAVRLRQTIGAQTNGSPEAEPTRVSAEPNGSHEEWAL